VQARVLLAILAAALAASPAHASALTRVYTIPGYGIRVALPSPWKAIDANHLLSGVQLQELERDNPELAGALSLMAKPGSPIKLFAYDPNRRKLFATNLNVVVTSVPASIGFAAYASALEQQIRMLSSVSRVNVSQVALPGGRAVRLSYRLRFVVAGKPLLIATLQYAFLHAGQSVVFTYTTLPQLQPTYASTFTASARSIRLA
jgi:hypothetical protein